MTPAEFVALGQSRFGSRPGWQRRYAEALGVSQASVSAVARGRPVPRSWTGTINALRLAMQEGRRVPLAPASPRRAGDVDLAAREALWPALDVLAVEAQQGGWSEREVVRAVLAWGAVRVLRVQG